MAKKWITFDLDGTLMLNPFGRWVFPEINAVVSKWAGASVDIAGKMIEEHQRRMSQSRYVDAYDWDEMLSSCLSCMDIPQRLDIEGLVKKHCVVPKIRLLEEDVLSVLGELRAKGYALAAVTNGFYKYQYPVMEALGLAKYFDEIVTPERAGTGKPDPAILQLLEGEVAAHVGDRLDHDIQMANRYRCLSVLIEHRLPRELCSVHPQWRAAHPGMEHVYREKWRKESKRDTTLSLPAECRPQVVLASIGELLTVLDDKY
ncbi:HAD family hydrolase [Brevibacillus ruminantium]|uniref:HAD family hydrolase n=1 Tax=Brevibacillus ruminantium TaxID=2950604 RepID=A0ABY4WGX2_9BACL|nr:HAD family hydrolase [Brevibacillus ruminantium]USG66372.1 HAD family hydrolase [Brevibacillus ruminantium]